MKTLRIGYLSTMYHTSHILKGLKWVEKDLKNTPEWNLFGTGPAIVESFRQGKIDIAYIGLPPAMIGIGSGLSLKCIGGGHAEGTVLIGSSKYTGMENSKDILPLLKQFEDCHIGSPSRGSIHDVILRFLIKKYGLRINVKNYAWADLIPEAITDGEIEAAVGTPPLAVLAESWYGHKIIIPPEFLWPFNPSYGIVAEEKLLQDRALLEGFLSLHERACNIIIENPSEAARIVTNEVRVVKEDFIIKVFSVSPRYCASLPPQYMKSTMAFIPALKEMGYLKKDLSEKEVFDLSFIKKIHPEPHHYHKHLKL